MADITMCEDKECPKKESCLRYTATANPYRQSYFCSSPRVEGEECVWFWDNEERHA
jgi:hypothetical protein